MGRDFPAMDGAMAAISVHDPASATGAWSSELAQALATARRAGALVRDAYERASTVAYQKNDGSVVTDADLAADRLIRDELANRFPDDALLTEETADDPG